MPTKQPIFFTAYNRPHYLADFLRSLAPQVEDRQVICYLDQPESQYDYPYVADSLRAIKEILPQTRFIQTDVGKNIGIAEATRIIRKVAFKDLGLSSFICFEDDLVLSPNYIFNTEHMMEVFSDNPIVGTVSCMGEPHRVKEELSWVALPPKISNNCPYREVPTVEWQRKKGTKIIPNYHLWGYGIFKRAHEDKTGLFEKYYELLEGRPYKYRDHAKIYEFLAQNGIQNAVTSRDSVNCAIMAMNGLARISTAASCGKMIGCWGLHSSQAEYEKQKWKELPCFCDVIDDIDYSQWQVEEILNLQRKNYIR